MAAGESLSNKGNGAGMIILPSPDPAIGGDSPPAFQKPISNLKLPSHNLATDTGKKECCNQQKKQGEAISDPTVREHAAGDEVGLHLTFGHGAILNI
jgi:hypothetical protein